MSETWRWPFQGVHQLSATAGRLSFVGGAGDFDGEGAIRNPGVLDAQIRGAVDNIATALAAESCTLDDVVRLTAFFCEPVDDWQVIAALQALFPQDPAPVIWTVPDPMQPFAGQLVQIQAVAMRGWRDLDDIRVAGRDVPPRWRERFGGGAVTAGLRAGELIVLANRSAENDLGELEHTGDGVAQTDWIMARHRETLATLGAGMQDAVKVETFFFGTSREQWAPLAAARSHHFAEPGPVATAIPCHRLNPDGALTRIGLTAMRQVRKGVDKYIPRDDSWPDRIWDWKLPFVWRQAIRLREVIWLGGQTPSEPFTNTQKPMYPGDLCGQTRQVMSYLDDLLRGFGRSTGDLRMLMCYYTCPDGQATTRRFLDTLASCVAGPLPPTTLCPRPSMQTPEGRLEIWGIAQA
jgi:enamine deaminase RidA (YjgF/YER057c/UK114 family)